MATGRSAGCGRRSRGAAPPSGSALLAVVTLLLAACAAPAASSAPTRGRRRPSASAATSPSAARHRRRVRRAERHRPPLRLGDPEHGRRASSPPTRPCTQRSPSTSSAPRRASSPARIAPSSGPAKIGGDVFWMTDPLSIAGLRRARGSSPTWTPSQAADLDPGYVGDAYWGTRLLNMVMVKGSDLTPGPADWKDLLDPAYKDAVAIPDPGFAGSAFGALGYFTESAELRHGLLPGTQGERRRPGESARRRDDRRRRGPVQGRDDARQLGANGHRQGLTRRAGLADRRSDRDLQPDRRREVQRRTRARPSRSSTSSSRPRARRRSAPPAGSRSATAPAGRRPKGRR